jgi:flagellin-like protein
MQHNKNCRKRESGVSEVIGAVLLIALVVTAVAIVSVGLLSQPLPKKIPTLEAVISNDGYQIQITHNGGDTLQKEDFAILVNGQDKTADFLKGSNSWSPGESLIFDTPNPDSVRIVYTASGASAVLSSAVFGQDGQPTAQYTITASSGAGGSINPTGAVPMYYGQSKTFTITPVAGYHVADVLVDSSSVGNVTTYQFTSVAASHTILATFAPNQYTITATTGVNGNITPAGTTNVNSGSSQIYTITPIAGYHVADVLVDSSSVGNVPT